MHPLYRFLNEKLSNVANTIFRINLLNRIVFNIHVNFTKRILPPTYTARGGGGFKSIRVDMRTVFVVKHILVFHKHYVVVSRVFSLIKQAKRMISFILPDTKEGNND